MRRFFPLILAAAILLPSGARDAQAEVLHLNSTYELGDNYSLHLGRKAGGLHYSSNIIGLKKHDVAMQGDEMLFTLNQPYNDFGGDRASLGFVYTRPLRENVTTSLSFTGGPTSDSLTRQDVAVSFYVHVKLQ
jgi:hypothetical protein